MYSLRSELLVKKRIKTDVSTTKIHVDTFISWTSNFERRGTLIWTNTMHVYAGLLGMPACIPSPRHASMDELAPRPESYKSTCGSPSPHHTPHLTISANRPVPYSASRCACRLPRLRHACMRRPHQKISFFFSFWHTTRLDWRSTHLRLSFDELTDRPDQSAHHPRRWFVVVSTH